MLQTIDNAILVKKKKKTVEIKEWIMIIAYNSY
jgi:hypothetical protein